MENKFFTMIDQNQELSNKQMKCHKNQQTCASIFPDTKTRRKQNNHKISQKYSSCKWRDRNQLQKSVSQNSYQYYDNKALQQHSFKKNWQSLKAQLMPHIGFQMMIPVPQTKQGQILLQNGLFLVNWLKILSTSQYINVQAISQIAHQKFACQLTTNKQIFLAYCDLVSNRKNKQKNIKNQHEMDIQTSDLQNILKRLDNQYQIGKFDCSMQLNELNKETDDSSLQIQHTILDYQINKFQHFTYSAETRLSRKMHKRVQNK